MLDGQRRVLDPVERVSEVLFGLIMVLTFTGSMSAASAGRAEVREMMIGALGCNLAWGIVDAVMYVLTSLLNRGRGLAQLRSVRAAHDPGEARAVIAGSFDPLVAALLRTESLEALRQDLAAAQTLPQRPPLRREDVRGAVEVCLLVFLSTFPVVIPFMIIAEPMRAIRVSNAVAVIMLCAGGYSLGRYSGMRPWVVAISMATLGVVLVAITIVLGG